MQRKADPSVAGGLSIPDVSMRRLALPAHSLIWTTDSKLRITTSQGTGLLRLSLLPEDLRGINLQEYLEPQGSYAPLLSAHREALEGRSSSFELVCMGQMAQIKLDPLRNDLGEITGVIGVAVELVEWRR